MNEDVFYVDGEQFYNLKYTHKELIDLFKKIEDNEVLTKEQYDKLINEIGLDNISTFDLNYYNLKNLPYIPVRVGDLFNDVGYDVKARVDNEFKLLRADLENEIERIDSIKAELENIDIEELLKQIGIAQSQADYLSSDIRNLNGVVFSFERSIELVQDKTAEVINEFEALKNMQERDEYRLDNIHKFLTTHTEDIQFLLRFYETERERLTNTIKDLIELQKAVDLLEEYHGIMNNVDLRVSEIEEFIKLLNPEDIDLNIITTLENKLKELQEQHKVYDSFHKTITKQIEELSFSFQQQIDELVNIYFLDTINDRILSIQDQLKKNITALADHNKKLTEHAGHLDNINSKLESITTSINRNASDIGELRNRIFNNESWYEEIKQQLTNIQNTISNNISDINDLKSKIPGINNRLDSINDKLDEFDDRIAEIKEDVSLLENRVLNLEEQSLTFATKALVNSLELKAYINEEEEVITIKLMLDDESLSSVDIPFFAKKEEERDRIARTMNAWTNYSITATENESLDTTARVDKGLTDYSTTN